MGFLEDVIETRAYRQAKAMVDAADTKEAAERLPKTRLFELVKEITGDLVKEWEEKQRRGALDDD